MRMGIKFKLLIIAFVVATVVFFVYYYIFTTTRGLFDEYNERIAINYFTTIEQEIKNKLNNYKNEALLLTSFDEVKEFAKIKENLEKNIDSELQPELEAKLNEDLEKIEKIFFAFVDNEEDFMQARLIDKQGDEVVRVGRDDRDTRPYIFGEEELQSKSDRYYFQKSINLNKGEVYVSELDLNVEEAEVEMPYKPVIRFATPIIDSADRIQGVVVINVFADKILDFIRLSPYEHTYLMDQDGYFIFHPTDVSKEWGKSLGLDIRWHGIKDDPDYFDDYFKTSKFVRDSKYDKRSPVGFYYRFNYSITEPERYWVLAIEEDYNTYFSGYLDTRDRLLLQSGVFMLMMFLIFLLLSLRLLRPIKQISKSVEYLNLGRYDISIPVTSRDEFGEFAKKMNELITNIRVRDREKYEFIASASHQLRTPATVVRTYTDLLTEEMSRAKNKKKFMPYIEEISRGNKQVLAIMNDFLQYIELSDNYLATNLEKVNARKLTEEMIGSFEDEIKSKKLKVQVDVPSKIIINVDLGRFKVILDNLIDNAIEYSNDRGEIIISAGKVDNYIQFEIADQGIGIANKDKPFIFDKFYRARNAYAKKNIGTGLGLVISKIIIKGHGGKIWYESKKGKGTTFYFTILNV
ncbi:MAG: HAMP domain-containing protein [Candidatus Magasanikbacteria bacterium]|nr:HAMP domain-containing protein [Candidatus Magasanikbacteria bacterium]